MALHQPLKGDFVSLVDSSGRVRGRSSVHAHERYAGKNTWQIIDDNGYHMIVVRDSMHDSPSRRAWLEIKRLKPDEVPPPRSAKLKWGVIPQPQEDE